MFGCRKNLSHALSHVLTAALLLAFMFAAKAFAWGDDAHRAAVRGAVVALPAEMGQFFQVNSRFLAEHSTDPDYIPDRTAEQKADHFLDLDLYNIPAAEIPHDRKKAEEMFGRDVVIERGLLPWAIEREYRRLVGALKSRNWQEARLAAAHLSHFTADAKMPLHATANYDGQFTGNLGIHGRIEWELLPRYIGSRIVLAAEPTLISDRIEWAFEEIEEDLSLVSAIMEADSASREVTVLDSEAYYAALNRRIGQMLEQRLREAATAIASLYYTAWAEAGRPAMPPKCATMIVMDVPYPDFELLQDAAETEAESRSADLDPQDAVAVIAANAPKRLWQFTVEWGPVCDVAESPAISYTGDEPHALQSAVLALRRLPGIERRMIVVTDGLGTDERIAAAMKELADMGVIVKVVSANR